MCKLYVNFLHILKFYFGLGWWTSKQARTKEQTDWKENSRGSSSKTNLIDNVWILLVEQV